MITKNALIRENHNGMQQNNFIFDYNLRTATDNTVDTLTSSIFTILFYDDLKQQKSSRDRRAAPPPSPPPRKNTNGLKKVYQNAFTYTLVLRLPT